MNKAPRVVGIVICGAILLIPQVVCYLDAPPAIVKAAHFLSLLFPLTFYALANLFIDEGRARERERIASEARR